MDFDYENQYWIEESCNEIYKLASMYLSATQKDFKRLVSINIDSRALPHCPTVVFKVSTGKFWQDITISKQIPIFEMFAYFRPIRTITESEINTEID